jgi:hypothetical protein
MMFSQLPFPLLFFLPNPSTIARNMKKHSLDISGLLTPFAARPKFPRVTLLSALVAASLLAGTVFGQLSDSTKPAPVPSLPEQITQALIFPQRIVWVGGQSPSNPDNQTLWQAIGLFKSADVAAGLAALEAFVAGHPTPLGAPRSSAISPSTTANAVVSRSLSSTGNRPGI